MYKFVESLIHCITLYFVGYYFC